MKFLAIFLKWTVKKWIILEKDLVYVYRVWVFSDGRFWVEATVECIPTFLHTDLHIVHAVHTMPIHRSSYTTEIHNMSLEEYKAPIL